MPKKVRRRSDEQRIVKGMIWLFAACYAIIRNEIEAAF